MSWNFSPSEVLGCPADVLLAGQVLRVAWCDTQQQNLNGSFSPANIVLRACVLARVYERGAAGIKMTTEVLGCRCAQRAGEVTLAMVAASESSQPSVSGHEEVTPHHCLVWRGTVGSLEGPDLPVLGAERDVWTLNTHVERIEIKFKGVQLILCNWKEKKSNKLLPTLLCYGVCCKNIKTATSHAFLSGYSSNYSVILMWPSMTPPPICGTFCGTIWAFSFTLHPFPNGTFNLY